jgi:hypothetical protein
MIDIFADNNRKLTMNMKSLAQKHQHKVDCEPVIEAL